MNNNIGPTIREQAHWIDDYSHVDILLKPTNIIWRAIMCIKKLTRSLRTSLDKSMTRSIVYVKRSWLRTCVKMTRGFRNMKVEISFESIYS